MASKSIVRPATAEDIAAVFGTIEKVEVLEVGGRVAAVASLARRIDGRLFANFEIMSQKITAGDGARAVLAMRSVLVNVNEPVFTACHAVRYATAPRLLRALGFRPTDEIQGNGNRVWVRGD